MARRREEARLRDVRLFGLAFGARQRVVEPRQLLGAFLDAPLQIFIGALERLGGLDARSHVGRGRDEAAVRHVVGADFHDETALREALADRFGA